MQQTLINAVKAYAITHYEIDGWDIVAECYEDEDIGNAIGNATTPADAIAAVKADNALQTMLRDEIRAENGDFEHILNHVAACSPCTYKSIECFSDNQLEDGLDVGVILEKLIDDNKIEFCRLSQTYSPI